MKPIASQKNMGKWKYRDSKNYSCQTNLDESSHTIEKLRKSAKRVGFEEELHIEIRMELVQQIDKAVELIEDKYCVINKI